LEGGRRGEDQVEVKVKVKGEEGPSCAPIAFQQAILGDNGVLPQLRKLETLSP
jgi:hypothetical protein